VQDPGLRHGARVCAVVADSPHIIGGYGVVDVWTRFTDTVPPSPPIAVHVLDAPTTQELGLQQTGALLARPDGRDLRRWTGASTAIAAAAKGSVLQTVAGDPSSTAKPDTFKWQPSKVPRDWTEITAR
jgi:hypothetical protein